MSNPTVKRVKMEESAPFAAIRKTVTTMQSRFRSRAMVELEDALVAGVYPATSALGEAPFVLALRPHVAQDDEEDEEVVLRKRGEADARLIEALPTAIELARENGGRWHVLVCQEFYTESVELVESSGLFVRLHRDLSGLETDAQDRFKDVGASVVFFSFFE